MSLEEHQRPATGTIEDARLRREADDLLDEFAHASVAYLAQGLLDRADAYDGGVGEALALAAELRRRQEAGVRFWPATNRRSEDGGSSASSQSA